MSIFNCAAPCQSGKMKGANITREEKPSHAEVAKIYGKIFSMKF